MKKYKIHKAKRKKNMQEEKEKNTHPILPNDLSYGVYLFLCQKSV